jgi:purine-cytosine permease-like protein
MKKIILLTAAVLLFLFMGYGYAQWIQSGGTPPDSWRTLTSDWLLVTVAADIVTFNLICLVYFFGDVTRQARFSTPVKAAWLVGILLIGAPVFLAYLGLRKA